MSLHFNPGLHVLLDGAIGVSIDLAKRSLRFNVLLVERMHVFRILTSYIRWELSKRKSGAFELDVTETLRSVAREYRYGCMPFTFFFDSDERIYLMFPRHQELSQAFGLVDIGQGWVVGPLSLLARVLHCTVAAYHMQFIVIACLGPHPHLRAKTDTIQLVSSSCIDTTGVPVVNRSLRW